MQTVQPLQCPTTCKANLIYLFHFHVLLMYPNKKDHHRIEGNFVLFIQMDFMPQRRTLETCKTTQYQSNVMLHMIAWPFI